MHTNHSEHKIWAGTSMSILALALFFGIRTMAGTLSPTLSPAATSYTLTDIYTRISANTAATSGNHPLGASASPAGTFYTLSQIYDAIPTIDATKVFSGTSYLGVAGTLNLACNVSTFNGTANLVADGFDGSGDGTNRWCMTSSTNGAAANQIFSGYKAWVSGVETTGTLALQTLLNSSTTVNAGYYDATTLTAVDSDLIAANIMNGVVIFGVTGTATVSGYTYGDSSNAALVLTTATGAGTYNAANLSTATVKSGTAFGVSLTGAYPSAVNTLTNASGTTDLAATTDNISSSNGAVEWWQSDGTRQTATLDFPTISNVCSSDTSNNSAGTLSVDATKVLTTTTYCGTTGTYNAANLSTATVKSGTAFGVSLTGDYPSATNTLTSASGTADLAASGSNISSDNGSVEWWKSDGTYQSATLDFPTISNVCSSDTSNNSAGTLSITAGTVGTGNTICGTAGTLLGSMWNGTSGSFTGGSQANGGADDSNALSTAAAGRYAGSWTTCTSGADNWCGTGLSSAAAKDNSTGLVWSLPCNGVGCTSFSTTATAYSWDNSGANNSSTTASALCSNQSGWSLPNQKQLIQVYIDGFYINVEAQGTSRNYWSATTVSSTTTSAWIINETTGATSAVAKNNAGGNIRCVR